MFSIFYSIFYWEVGKIDKRDFRVDNLSDQAAAVLSDLPKPVWNKVKLSFLQRKAVSAVLCSSLL